MKIYKLACIGAFVLLLSGCSTSLASTEESSSKEVSEVVKEEPAILDANTYMDNYQSRIGGFKPLVIDEEIMSLMGASKSYFSYSGDVPFKISLLNTGTENFLFKIQNVDKEILIADGILDSKESYEKVFDGFSEGAYVISYLVEEEESPIDLKLKVKVELLP